MKILSVKYGSEVGENGPIPKGLKAEIPLAEAVAIANLTGRLADHQLEHKSRVDRQHSHEVYHTLAGDFFNIHFYDGVDEATRLVGQGELDQAGDMRGVEKIAYFLYYGHEPAQVENYFTNVTVADFPSQETFEAFIEKAKALVAFFKKVR